MICAILQQMENSQNHFLCASASVLGGEFRVQMALCHLGG